MEQFFKQNNFSGGLADSQLFGIKGSFAEMVGVDIHSTPGVLKVSQALTKESVVTGTEIVTDFCKFAIDASDGNSYWFGDTGNIYKRTSTGVWSKVKAADADGAILGAKEFNGYFYWANATKLHEMIITGNWTTDIDSVATWPKTLISATYHPMIVQGLYMFIGNNRNIASVDDAGTFTATGTPSITFDTLPPSYTIINMIPFGTDFIMGTRVNSTYESARVFRQDFTLVSPLTDDDIPETGVNCFIRTDNYIFIQAGSQGTFYYYDGKTIEKVKKIPGDYVNKTMIVHPGSTCVFQGRAMIGVSNLSGNPCLEGIYSLGQYDRNYPLALVLEYVISPNKLTSIEIGAMLAIGTKLVVAWKNGSSTYGVDVINYSAKYSGAYVKTLAITGEREGSKTFEEYVIGYKQKPAGTDIALSYDKNYAGTFADTISLRDEVNYNKLFGDVSFDAGVVQFKIAFTVSGNDSPSIDLFYTKWNSREVL